ncbi:MAG: glycosyltransferase family 1 protein, partial [Planctomycetota bacterium]
AGLNGARGSVEARLQENVRRRLGIRGPFVLHVGALDPHKNFPAALSAFLQVRGRRPLQLVVVGAVDPGIEHFASLCSRKRIPDVVFTGYLPRRDLDALYASAVALLFLSKSEGFGFPLLEAMAAGCPVIGSDVTSHPEVVGTAGILVPLASAAESAAAALMRLMSDPALAARLRGAGSAQAATFTWDSVADRTLQVWRSMLGARELALPAYRGQLAPLPVGL